jgi:hypothetical protein
MEHVDTQPYLFKVVGALYLHCGFAGSLHGRQQKGDQHSDNRNDNEKFDKSKSVLVRAAIVRLRNKRKSGWALALR